MDTAELQVVQPVAHARFGKYLLLALIGHGGMGEIFLAKRMGPAGFEKLLVIKRILPHLARSPEFVEMFLDEARVAARLNHPHVVQVYEVGKEEGHYYMAMEYIDGQSLSRLVRESIRSARFPQPEFFARIISYTLEGLHHAHSSTDVTGKPLNIVHRDVSPQNIMITYDGGVKLLDFGIAKARTRIVQTQTGAIKGKYSYMSPEQCWGKPLDARSDVFAAGIILYEVCTGRRLFKSENELTTMKKITEQPIAAPRSLNPHLPHALEQIIMRALEKDADQRYQSAELMRNDLEEFLASRTSRLGTFEISGFMKELFSEQIAAQRESIQEVLAGTANLDEPLLPEDESSSVSFHRSGGGTSQRLSARGSRLSKPAAAALGAPGSTELAVGLNRSSSTLSVAAGEHHQARPAKRSNAGVLIGSVSVIAIALGLYLWLSGSPPAAVVVGPVSHAAGGATSGGEPPPPDPQKPSAAPAAAASNADPAAPEPASARCEIYTQPPGATVFLDGEDTGFKTPAILTGIKPGEHRIRLVLDGHIEQGDVWSARPGGSQTLKLTLTPNPVGRPKDPALARKQPGKRDRMAKGPPTTIAPLPSPPAPLPDPKTLGSLSIDTSPWTDVYLMGRKLGRTPLLEVKLPAGTHDLRLINENKGIKEMYRVTIRPGQLTSKRLGL